MTYLRDKPRLSLGALLITVDIRPGLTISRDNVERRETQLFKMTWLLLLVLSVMDIAAVYFNVRMLIICFKDKTKYKFLESCRVLAICQGACHVIILVADTAEWWNGFTILPSKTCSFFRVLSLSVMFYQTCNLTAMMTVYNEHRTQDASSKVRMYAALSMGGVGSSMIAWHNCFAQAPTSLFALKAAFVLVVTFLILLLAAALFTNDEYNTLESQAAICTSASPLWVRKENMRPLFFTILLLPCLVCILSGVPNTDSLLYEDYEQVTLFKEALYSVITKFAVGIVLPVTLYDLINSSYVNRKNQIMASII